MPNYRYQCVSCKEVIDAYHSIKDELTACKNCGGILERVICFDGYVELKGEGFHKNDYPKIDKPNKP